MKMNQQELLSRVNEWVLDHWLKLLIVIVIGLFAYYLGTKLVQLAVRRVVKAGGQHRVWHKKDIEKRQKTLEALFVNIWRIVIFLTLLYALLNIFVPNAGEILAPAFASAGIIGIALGFGAQSLIKDFISGIFIISENQFRVGDVVELDTGSGTASGTVERIGSRTTVLRDVDGNVHFLPNGLITHAVNKTMGYSVARFVILVQPDTDVEKAIEIIDGLGATLTKEDVWKDKILTPPAYVMMGEITGNSIEIIVSGKTQPSDQWSVVAEMRKRIHRAFEKANIELAVTPLLGNQATK